MMIANKPIHRYACLSVIIMAIVVIIYSPSNAFAGGIYYDPCGNGGAYGGAFGMSPSPVYACVVGTHGTNNFSYTNSGATGSAGQNYFDLHISPIFLVGSTAAYPAKNGGQAGWATYQNIPRPEPTWSASVVNVPTLLELDGTVVLHTNSSIKLILTGQLDGNTQTIDWSASDSATGNVTVNESIDGAAVLMNLITRQMVFQLAIPDYSSQPKGDAIETLTINISGSGDATTHYFANGSPLYEGAAPEPGTVLLMGIGLAALVGCTWVQRKTEA